MMLRGILTKAFNNILCLRGFSPLIDLANMSSADDNYQRPEDEEHSNEIVEFLDSGRYTFFPEVILGASMSSMGMKEEEIESLYKAEYSGSGFSRKKLGYISASVFVKNFTYDSVSSHYITCSFYDLEALPDGVHFARIDGNHRLQAAHRAKKQVKQYMTPFCLVLFRNNNELQTYGSVFFHNINYRAIPIPEERNLDLILARKIDDKYLFPDEDINDEHIFGSHYSLARKILESKILDTTPKIKDLIKNNEKTFVFNISKMIPKDNILLPETINLLQKAFFKTEQAIEKYDSLARYKRSMLEAITYCFFANKKGDLFVKWIAENQLADVVDVSPLDAIAIFEKTHSRGPYQVFVAMPYVSYKRVNDFNRLFDEALRELEQNSPDGIRYKLIPIMRFRGASQRIDQRLIKYIKECDIFIADITSNNANVIFEVGLAEGAGKPIFLIREDNDNITDKIFNKDEEAVKSAGQIPFDMDKLQYIPYSSTGYYNDIKGIVKRHLPEIAKSLQIVDEK